MELMICYAIGVLVGLIVGVGLYRKFLDIHTAGTLYLFDADDGSGTDIYAEFIDDPRKISGSFARMKISKKYTR